MPSHFNRLGQLCCILGTLALPACGISSGVSPFDDNVSTTIPSNTNSPLGSNVSPLESWSPGWVFVDIFPKTTNWVSNVCDAGGWGDGDTLTVDDNNWVSALPSGSCAATHVMWDLGTHYPAGTYVLLWEGDGTFSIGNDVSPAVTHTQGTTAERSGDLNRLTFTVDAANQQGYGIGLTISSVDTDYLRNFRMIVPGGACGESTTSLDPLSYCATDRGGEGSCPAGQSCFDFEEIYWDRFTDSTADMKSSSKVVFHPTYLSNYQGYSLLRFMKWSRVEDLGISNWSERVSLSRQTFSGDAVGVPLEYMLAMSSLLDADAWLNIPVNATDDYVTSMATLTNQLLDTNLRVFIEYGNELFNSEQSYGYPQMVTLANGGTITLSDGDSDLIKAAKAGAAQSVSKINTFANAFDTTRTVRVLAGFHANSSFSSAMLNYSDTTSQIDAYAVAPYIGPDRRYVDDTGLYDTMSEDQLIQELFTGDYLNSGSSLLDHNTYLQNASDLLSGTDIPLISYEGGAWFVLEGTTTDVVNAARNVHRSDSMATAYDQLLDSWRSYGGHLFVHFNHEDLWSTDNIAGAIRYQTETRADSPKFNSLMNYIETRPCTAWNNCN